jgi:UV DNA damage endonuclease
MLDLMGVGSDGVMVIHGGGVYGDKAATIRRWIDRYHKLPESIRRRLVLENCEKIFNIEDCLDVSAATGVPVVFDVFHFECYTRVHRGEYFEPIESYIEPVLATWPAHIKPKFHLSSQTSGGRCGAHADFVDEIPAYLLEIPQIYRLSVDIMIEAKAKEAAIARLYAKYPELK